MSRKQQKRGFGNHGIQNPKQSVLQQLFRSLLSTGKQFLGIKNNLVLAGVNLALLIALTVLAGEVLTLLSDKVLKSDALLAFLKSAWKVIPDLATFTLGGTLLYALFRNQEEQGFKKLIGLGSSYALVLLLVFNGIALGAHTVTQHPCFNVPQANTAKHEVLVLLAEFEQANNAKDKPSEQWMTILPHRMKQAITEQNIRIEELKRPITESEAATESNCRNATMVIWGRVANGVINVHYKIDLRWGGYLGPMETYLEKGNHEEIAQFIKDGGDTTYVLSSLVAKLLQFDRRYEEAVKFATQAINTNLQGREAEMSLDSVFATRASSETSLGKMEAALEDYNRAISLNPRKAMWYQNRGTIFHYLKRYQESINDYTIAMNLLEKDVELVEECGCGFSPYISRSAAYMALGNTKAALEDANKAVEKYPHSAWAYVNKANILANTGNFQSALELLDTVIAGDPVPFDEAYFSRALIHNKLGHYQQALDDIKRYLEITKSPRPEGTKLYQKLRSSLNPRP